MTKANTKALVNGIALYGIEELSLKEAFVLALTFFETLGVTPNAATYFYKHAPDKDGEIISSAEVSLTELQAKVDTGELTDFRLFYFVNDLHWDLSFSYTRKETTWKLSFIDIQFLDSLAGIKQEEVLAGLTAILSKTRIDYGIGYQLIGYTSSAFDYVFSLDGSKL